MLKKTPNHFYPEIITQEINSHLESIKSINYQFEKIERVLDQILKTRNLNKKILICGNGGSAADSQHFASELVGRYERDRDGSSAISLTTDSSALTAIANDYGFENIFSRQIESIGKSDDLLIVFSTSGDSINLIKAVKAARRKDIFTIGLLGKGGGSLKSKVDLELTIESNRTCRIQEAHALLIHIFCELLDRHILSDFKIR